MQKAYWTRTDVSRSTFKGHKSTNLKKTIKSNHRFRLSLHVVGKWVFLVVLWPNPARRDKPWNYIALEFQRYTKHLLITGNLYRQIENVWGIPFPKGMKQKYGVLGELFRKLVFYSL
jgi:hypothetical protein